MLSRNGPFLWLKGQGPEWPGFTNEFGSELVTHSESEAFLLSMKEVRAVVVRTQPCAILYAGWRNFVAADNDPDAAFRLWAEAPIGMAAAALELNIPIVFISHPFVFGGRGHLRSEDDVPAPPSAVAEAVVRGEAFVQRTARALALVIRAGPVLSMGREVVGSGLTISSRQKLTPVLDSDLARIIRKIVQTDARGIVHVGGPCTEASSLSGWVEFGRSDISGGDSSWALRCDRLETLGLQNLPAFWRKETPRSAVDDSLSLPSTGLSSLASSPSLGPSNSTSLLLRTDLEVTRSPPRGVLELSKNISQHTVVGYMKSAKAVQVFLECHVYCVWDFMRLLESVRESLLCDVDPIWRFARKPEAVYEIRTLLREEEAIEISGGYMGHFELYLDVMRSMGADLRSLEVFLDVVYKESLEAGLELSLLTSEVRALIQHSNEVCSGELPQKVGALVWGYEALILPSYAMLHAQAQFKADLSVWATYLELYIASAVRRRPAAERLFEQTCGSNPSSLERAAIAARKSLECRVGLLDAVERELRF